MSAVPFGGVRYFRDVYRANMRVGMALMLQYRFAVLIWGVWGFVGPLISLAVWTATTAARGGGAIVNPANGASYGRADFAAYFLVYMIFGHLTMSWDAFEFGYRIRSGGLSPALLKPLNPIHADASRNISFKIVTGSMILPAWIALFFILRPTPPSSVYELALALPALVLAGIIRYVIQYALAVIAFWTTRVEAINQFFFTLDSFMAGRLAPLALLPPVLGTVAYYSPFRAMGAFPVELALGRVPPDQILLGFGLQIFWLGAGLLLFRVLWAAGIRQYSAVGA